MAIANTINKCASRTQLRKLIGPDLVFADTITNAQMESCAQSDPEPEIFCIHHIGSGQD